jgi:colanic acid biosynthesis glycosyl transferase WcaI
LTTISEPMLVKLRNMVGDDRRVVLIPDWIHQSLQQEIDRQRTNGPSVRANRRLLYCGNLGVKQGLPQFLESVKCARSGWNLRIYGGGAQAVSLRMATSGADGVEIADVLPEAEYVAALLETSACVITQQTGVGANFLPSKLLPALATATPVLAVCDQDSPLGREVRAGGFGEVIPPGDVGALSDVLSRWCETPALLAEFSCKALQWSGRYSRESVLGCYEAELRSLMVGDNQKRQISR